MPTFDMDLLDDDCDGDAAAHELVWQYEALGVEFHHISMAEDEVVVAADTATGADPHLSRAQAAAEYGEAAAGSLEPPAY
mmetsp:Transcript_104068/g.330883  ORF Transcript_104068/g.330883 Transcript_104068/m.330883 type:complete len:80 (-) Transcript_104068:36-275(-)